MSQALRPAKYPVPRELKAARGQSFTFALDDGVYRLRERFVGSKVDRRTTGPGLSTPDGLKAGTRIRVQAAPWLDEAGTSKGHREVVAPWTLGEHVTLAIGRDGVWHTPIPDDMERLFRLLDRDESLESWLDNTTGTGKYQNGYGDSILLELLTAGTVTKEQIIAAKERVQSREKP